MAQRERDRFDALPDPPQLGDGAVTQANVLETVRRIREAVKHTQLVQRALIDVSRATDQTASDAAEKLHDIDGHLFGSERFGPGILGELQDGQKVIKRLAWTVLGFLIVGLISVIAALMTGHVTIPG
jgi:hypothetical protein